MNGYESAVQQILTLIASTWKCQTLREEQSNRINWRDKIEKAELTPPFAILTISRMDRVAGGNSDGNLFALPLTITRVEPQTMGGDQVSDVVGQLVRLWGAIYRPPTTPEFYLCEEGTSFDTSREAGGEGPLLHGSAPLASGELKIVVWVDLTPEVA